LLTDPKTSRHAAARFASSSPRAIREPPVKHKTLPRKLLALHHALFRRRMHPHLVQFLDELAIRRLREEFNNTCRDLWPHFRHFLKLLLARRRQFFQRRKVFRQQLPRPLTHKLNPQCVNQPLQRIFLARLNLLQQVLRGFFAMRSSPATASSFSA